MQSYPTPNDSAHAEWMSPNFLKLHPGSVVHYFLDCKDDHYHSHPFEFLSHIVLGGYREELLLSNGDGTWRVEVHERKPGTSHTMPIDVPHKLVGLLDGPCITRCEYGPSTQKPGFLRFDEQGRLLHRFWDEEDWHVYKLD